MLEVASLTSLLAPLLALGLVAWILEPVYTYFRDPLGLRKFPAPNIWAALTPFWIMRETYLQRRSATIYEQHKKLGSVIRVSPDQVLFNDPKAISEIYGHTQARKLQKDTFYDKLAGDGYHDIVTSRDHEEHSRKRRYLANSFALKTVLDMESVIRENFERLLERIDASIDSNNDITLSCAFNIRLLFNYFTFDVIGDMAFGLPLGFLTKGKDQISAKTECGEIYEIDSLINTLHKGVRYSMTTSQLLTVAATRRLRNLTRCTNWFYQYTNAKSGDDFTYVARHQLQKRIDCGGPDRHSQDLFSGILVDKAGKDRDLPFMELVAETVTFLNAGSDTTAAALTNTIYYLLTNTSCFMKLREEVEAKLPLEDPEKILPYDLVRDMPYLRACIDESLRLRPPIAYPLQRLVTAPEGVTICGHHLRKGTVVAVPTYSVHRNEALFPAPESFNPDRWLNKDDPERIHALKNHTIPFSTGPRACIGRHIAIVELQLLISSLVRRYDISMEEPDQKLEIFERFQSNPGPLPIRLSIR